MTDYAKMKMELLQKVESGEALTEEDVLLAQKVARMNSDPTNLMTYALIKQKVENPEKEV